MIPKIQTRGKSFKGLATYLTHDPDAETAKRVAWTHALNLAHDHVPSAVDEMLWTARAAELLKQEAGIRAGGRASESAVKHFSLNWAPDQRPTQEQMIEATEGFLRRMKWDEHQAVLVAHNDKEHAHVHVMLNAVHPETGLALNESFEHRRAQAWALEYERENGRIYCEQRLKNPEEREQSPTRDTWLAFGENKKEFERQEKYLRENEPKIIDPEDKSKIANFAEWKILKEHQRHEREVFFAGGKLEFGELRRSIYREVREEFRERWADFYAAQKDGADKDKLAIVKTELLAEQKAVLEGRRDEACKELREARDTRYRELLDDQRELRFGLRARQQAGLDNEHFIQWLSHGALSRDRTGFREAADAAIAPLEKENKVAPKVPARPAKRERTGMKSSTDISINLGLGVATGFLSFFEGLADGLVPSNPDPRPRQPEPVSHDPDPFDDGVEDTHKREQKEREDADDEWRRRQRSSRE